MINNKASVETLVPNLKDEEIVPLLKKDKNLFGQIVLRYEAKLERYIRRLGVKNMKDIEDILQNIFLKTYKNINSFDTSLSFSTWIYRITHNESMNFFRHIKRHPDNVTEEDAEELLLNLRTDEDKESRENEFDSKLSGEIIRKAIDKLDVKYRDVLVLRYIEDKSYEEISDILEIPKSAAAVLVHRAKKLLEKEILNNEESKAVLSKSSISTVAKNNFNINII